MRERGAGRVYRFDAASRFQRFRVIARQRGDARWPRRAWAARSPLLHRTRLCGRDCSTRWGWLWRFSSFAESGLRISRLCWQPPSYPHRFRISTDAVQRAGSLWLRTGSGRKEARAIARIARQAELRQRLRQRIGASPRHAETCESDSTPTGPSRLISVGPVIKVALRIVDSWGVLDVTDGGGLIRDWQGEAIVPAPQIAKGKISGPGWTPRSPPRGGLLVPDDVRETTR